jgi:hypothetical protein
VQRGISILSLKPHNSSRIRPYRLNRLISAALNLCLLSGCCGNDIVKKYPSPDGKNVALLVDKNCGAPSPFVSHLYLSHDERIRDKDLIYSAEGDTRDIYVYWTGNDNMNVVFKEQQKIYYQVVQFGNISIKYDYIDVAGNKK